GATYPYCALDVCLQVADAVKGLGGGGGKVAVSKSLLASSLQVDERSQTLTFKLAATKAFGLIQGRSEFVLTETAKEYFFPTDDKRRNHPLLDCFERPRAFNRLIQRFDGSKLPEQDILANILQRECEVPESWAQRVAKFFTQSAKTASALDAQGFLRFRAARDGQLANQNPVSDTKSTMQSEDEYATIVDSDVSGTEQVATASVPQVPPGRLNTASEIFTITRMDDETGHQSRIYAEVPKGLTISLWTLLDSWVKSIKPEEKKP
ncbi:MAG TPA: hypothetical protein VK731_13955, partial [Candidatus Cybelea sp.]|nr:hypothetical protein [Candidatus Cybelea sp.]